MLTSPDIARRWLLIGTLVIATSCSAPQAAEQEVAVADSVAVAPLQVTPATEVARVRRPRTGVRVETVSARGSNSVEALVASSNPACMRLVEAEQRLRDAQLRYERANARHAERLRWEEVHETFGDNSDSGVTISDPPVEERVELLKATLAVQTLRDLCRSCECEAGVTARNSPP